MFRHVRRQMWVMVLVGTCAALPAGREASAANRTAEWSRIVSERIGEQRALCLVLGDGSLGLELSQLHPWLVQARVRSPQAARELLEQAAGVGLGLDRFTADVSPATSDDLTRLPHADNLLDAVLVPGLTDRMLEELDRDEVFRVLRPRGIVVLASPTGAVSGDEMQRWAATDGSDLSIDTWNDGSGTWAVIQKPVPSGLGDWTHWEHGPDNNPVSEDTIIRAPYLTQFLAHPMYIGMPSITTAAGGRTFLAVGHIAHHQREWHTLYRLIARNGYNGMILWERDLPEGYLVHRSAFIATDDVFYMIDGNRCLRLNAQTGEELEPIELTGADGHWKWMAMQDGTLYVLLGEPDPPTQRMAGDRSFGGWSWADLSRGYYAPRIPFGFGRTLVAYDLDQQQITWKRDEDALLDSRAMALRDERLYVFAPDAYARALSAKDGSVLWTNDQQGIRELIEEPGQNLTSTPGFRTACLTVATPDALIVQGQTRMNVVALSTDDGRLLWRRRKITNNPNAIYVDGHVILGVGPRGTHLVLDPVSGEVIDNLPFQKTACTRLTACADSFFCRGEGTLRYDRESGTVLVDGAQRPACNDGALPANGLLYMGPWQCDCNLSLIGLVAKGPVGDYDLSLDTSRSRVRREQDVEVTSTEAADSRDWPTYRGNNDRSSSTRADVGANLRGVWAWSPEAPATIQPPVAAGEHLWLAGADGFVRAVDRSTGEERWRFATPSPLKAAPTYWEGRLIFGGGDGLVRAVDAATGQLLWTFRAAPDERQIMVYDRLSSTWPVHSGVLVEDGVAYFAAGIIDQDGTYVYAVDAATGNLKWFNDTSGHLSEELRKGVSVQGNMTILGDQLILAGGNQVSPAVFDLETGECRSQINEGARGRPRANGGRFVGVFEDASVITGGRVLYSAPQNVSTKASFVAFTRDGAWQFTNGGIPPAWNDDLLVMVNFKHGRLLGCETSEVTRRFNEGLPDPPQGGRRWLHNLAQVVQQEGTTRWDTDLGQPEKFEAVSLLACPQSVLAVVRFQQAFRSQPQWFLVQVRADDGQSMSQVELPGDPLPGGLVVDRDGQVLVTLLDGTLLAYRGS